MIVIVRSVLFLPIFLIVGLTPACAQRLPKEVSPLIAAVIVGDAEKVSKLITGGTDVNTSDAYGNTALMYATGLHASDSERQMQREGKSVRREEHLSIVEMLLKNGAHTNIENDNGNTPLTLAIYHGRIATVQLFAKYKADLNYTGKHKWTPLMYASYHCFTDIAKVLLDHGADTRIKDVISKKTAMDLAIEQDCTSIQKLLKGL